MTEIITLVCLEDKKPPSELRCSELPILWKRFEDSNLNSRGFRISETPSQLELNKIPAF